MAQTNVNKQSSEKKRGTEEHPEAKRELEMGLCGVKREKCVCCFGQFSSGEVDVEAKATRIVSVLSCA
jgi:hypothetical protein